MLEDMIPRDLIIKAVAEIQDKREKYQDPKSKIEHDIWAMTNFTSYYIMSKCTIHHQEVDAYRKCEDPKQLYFEF